LPITYPCEYQLQPIDQWVERQVSSGSACLQWAIIDELTPFTSVSERQSQFGQIALQAAYCRVAVFD
jgi:hypothetical protein